MASSPNSPACGFDAPARRVALQQHSTYAVLAVHHRTVWVDHMIKLGNRAKRPEDGEVFQSKDDALDRLNSYGFSIGCRFSTKSARVGRANPTPNWDFVCAGFGEDTQNKHRLEPAKRQNKEGEIISKRQRDTTNNRHGCQTMYSVSYKMKRQRCPDLGYEFRGRWRVEEHDSSHILPADPLLDPIFRQKTDAFRTLALDAEWLRGGKQSYIEAQGLLKARGAGLILGRKEYYNLVRNSPNKPEDHDSMTVMLVELEAQGWRYTTRTADTEVDPITGVPKERKLVQIVFWREEAVEMIQRFCSGHVVSVDATFSTNNKRMPLLTAVGVTNEGTHFPVAFSYCPSEDEDSYTYFLESIDSHIFEPTGIQRPQVVLSDMAKGFAAAVRSNVWPGVYHQLCSWHCGKAMTAGVRDKGRHTKREMEGLINAVDENERHGIQHFVFQYVDSATTLLLGERRRHLLTLSPSDATRTYLNGQYFGKEEQFTLVHTGQHPNLGKRATQMNESWHATIKVTVHAQMSLHKAIIAIGDACLAVYTRHLERESSMMNKAATAIGNHAAFRPLRSSISHYAQRLIWKEWLELQAGEPPANEVASFDINSEIENCTCSARLQFSLPCRHILIPIHREEYNSIPLSLIHPRWRTKRPGTTGELLARPGWKPSYMREEEDWRPGRVDLEREWIDVIELRDRLPAEEFARHTNQIRQSLTNLKKAANYHKSVSELPIQPPDKIPQTKIRRTKPAQNARGMTRSEIIADDNRQAVKQQNEADREAAMLRERQQTMDEGIFMASSPPPPARLPFDLLDLEEEVPHSSQPRCAQTPPLPLAPSPIRAPKKAPKKSHKRTFSKLNARELEPPTSSDPLGMNSDSPLSTAPAVLARRSVRDLRRPVTNYKALNNGDSQHARSSPRRGDKLKTPRN